MLERTLSEGMITLSAYFSTFLVITFLMITLSTFLQTWRLKLSRAKTVTAAFHLHNREAKSELKAKNNDKFYHFAQCRPILV